MEWSPIDNSLSGIGVQSTTGSTLATIGPEARVPEVGDTLKIIAYPWNQYEIYREGNTPSSGSKIIELEVKAIKGVKVVFE